jgi:diacylglycerol kinase family enzyme
VAVLGQARAIDLGQVNGRHFAVMAGVGFDAQVVAQVGGSLKNLLGPWAYVLQGLALLAQYHPAHLEVELDGERLELLGWLVVLGNAALYAYRWRLAKNARIDDGLLDVCLFGARGVGQVVAEMSRVLTGRHLEAPQVCYRRAAQVRITSRPDLCVQADGEPAGATPLMASILPGALKVMVPNRG